MQVVVSHGIEFRASFVSAIAVNVQLQSRNYAPCVGVVCVLYLSCNCHMSKSVNILSCACVLHCVSGYALH